MVDETDESLSEQATLAPGLGNDTPGTAESINAADQKVSSRSNLFISRIPYQQVIDVCRLGFPCLRLYLAVCFQFGLQKGRGTVQITRARRGEMGLDNRAYLRALEKLERHNIVTVKRSGKYPVKITPVQW